MIVLDASVLIAYLGGRDSHHLRAHDLLARAIDEEFAASTVSLAEVLVAPAREGRLPRALRALQDLEIAELPFEPGAARALAELRAGTGLKMPDCCVLLAAEQAQARLASFDQRLLDVARDRSVDTVSH